MTPQHKQPCVSKIRDIRRGLSKISSRICNAMIEHRIAYRTYWISTNEHRDAIPQEILQSRLFLTSRNFETHGCQWYGVKQIKCFFADKGNCGPMFRATLYYLKYSFFYKIDFEHSEQCLFQVVRLIETAAKALVEDIGWKHIIEKVIINLKSPRFLRKEITVQG